MKSILIFSLFLLQSHTGWLTNFEEAKKAAVANNQPILLNFSGSDWCGPCKKMEKDFFSADVFTSYAKKHLVLLNADFPRSKKNKVSKEQVSQNELLAEKYNRFGKFPLTLLLDTAGNVLRTWEGCPENQPVDFLNEITEASGKRK